MKFALCLFAFLLGCIMTVFVGDIPAEMSLTTKTAASAARHREPVLTLYSTEMSIQKSKFGTDSSGNEITAFTCTNSHGYSMKLIDYGATLVAFAAPDRNGNTANIVLGCDDMAAYEANQSYLGSTVGRFCNRIANGKMPIGDETFYLPINNGKHHLHGGEAGFAQKQWKAEELSTDNAVGVRFTITSPNGDGGYPGKLSVTVDYLLTDDNELVMEFRAKTDKETHVNLTNHSYWNLSGAGQGTIAQHILQLNAHQLVTVDAEGIPTGELLPLESTVFDFRSAKPIGEDIENTGTQPTGFDHCYVVDRDSDGLTKAAALYDPESGRTMDILTTQPGVQFYTANWMDGSGSSGGFERHSAVALETQHFPDSPNQPSFPSTLLKPGESFYHQTIHRFGVR